MEKTSFSFNAIGTSWHISLYPAVSVTKKNAIFSEITNCIESFDKTYSRFRSDSLITKMSKKIGEYNFPISAAVLFEFYHRLYLLTDGLFTPMVGNLLSDAGYNASYSLTPKDLQPVSLWEDVILYANTKIMVKKPVLLDFGAAGKGYLVDLVSEVLNKYSVESFRINAGGDIVYKTKKNKKLRVGLEDPRDSKKIIGIAKIINESICGSAVNRRAWGKFNHVFNPKTKKSVTDVIATWVVAKDGLTADGLATALFFKPAVTFLSEFDFSYAIVRHDFSLETSQNFPAEFF